MSDCNHGFSRIGSLTLPVRKAGALRKFEIGRALAKAIRVIRGSIIMLLAMPLAIQAAEPTISVTATPRYPWSGMVDLSFTITGDAGTKYDTSFKVLDVEGNEALPIKTVYKSDGSRASATESLLPGTYRWSWDAKADVEEDMIKSSGCLSTASAVVFENRQLSSVTEFSAIPCGKAISDKTQRVKGTWVKTDGNGKEVQFAAADDKYTKCVCVHFEQQGSDIVANIKWAKYVDGTDSTAKDFNAITATSQTVATSEDSAGYGVRSVAIKTSDYKAPFCCERVSVVGVVVIPGYPAVSNGLVAWWPFDGDIRDHSGNGHHLSGTAAYVTSRTGDSKAAASFSGSSFLTQQTNLGVSGALTISCWIADQTYTIPQSDIDSYLQAIGHGNFGHNWCYFPMIVFPVSSTSGRGIGLSVAKNRIDVFAHGKGPSMSAFNVFLDYSLTVQSGWHHVAVTVGKSTTPILYYDGVKVKTGSDKWNGSQVYLNSGSTVGGGYVVINGGNNPRNYKGSLDDLTVYNRILSAAEIRSLYDAGK